ncbi:type III pantothenate kinase [Planctobacterium marinum]|uniref:type III pantothenate kinase n=1 Tax=Planctobacterium marinum TaxID=1631968 RepID=UPI001E331937|nr:type III pantothenate kinase [Planctobacterium marinum]MCC2608233.1 type III pantothenate kinase [Planctobacterium marinum]
MSKQHEVLLVDAGNSNVKSSFLSGDEFLLQADPLRDMALLQSTQRVILASVRSPSYSEQLQYECHSKGIEFTEIFTDRAAFGTRCAYQNFKTLGVDRWMMILAAARQDEQALLVVSIGTAMTVDLIHEKQHKGGWITPGFDMSKSALFSNTQQVFGNNDYPGENLFGSSTEHCVNFGCRAQVNGLIYEAINIAEQFAEKVKVLVCGGGVSLLDKEKFSNIEVDENLIFKGMKRFI